MSSWTLHPAKIFVGTRTRHAWARKPGCQPKQLESNAARRWGGFLTMKNTRGSDRAAVGPRPHWSVSAHNDRRPNANQWPKSLISRSLWVPLIARAGWKLLQNINKRTHLLIRKGNTERHYWLGIYVCVCVFLSVIKILLCWLLVSLIHHWRPQRQYTSLPKGLTTTMTTTNFEVRTPLSTTS